MGRKLKRNSLPPFVAILWDMLNSKAYIELTPSAKGLLPYFLGKVKISYNYPERYSEKFAFSYTEAKKYGLAQATFCNAYRDLYNKGFIDIFELGGLRGDGKSCSKFRLSKRWEDYKPEEKKRTPPVSLAKKDKTTIINERLAIYRKEFKNGNEKRKINAVTASEMETKDCSDAPLFLKVNL